MSNKKEKKFHVLEYNFMTREIGSYDVLPYFRRMWKETNWDAFEKSKVNNKDDLKNWIIRASSYNFWSRCEYEFLMGPWPYKEDTLINDLKKIDVHEQLMMNIEILTDILSEEFEIK